MTETLAPTDPRSYFAGAVITARPVIAAVTPEQMALPTPCPEFDVRTMLGHLLVVLDRVALLGEGNDPMALPTAHTDIADDAWEAEYLARAHRVQAAWTDPSRLTAQGCGRRRACASPPPGRRSGSTPRRGRSRRGGWRRGRSR